MLQLDDKFRITVDSSRQNFQLEKLFDVEDRKTREIKHEWKIIGYFGHSLGSVLKRYKDEAILNDDSLETINNVLEKFNELDRAIDRAVRRENIKMVSKSDD